MPQYKEENNTAQEHHWLIIRGDSTHRFSFFGLVLFLYASAIPRMGSAGPCADTTLDGAVIDVVPAMLSVPGHRRACLLAASVSSYTYKSTVRGCLFTKHSVTSSIQVHITKHTIPCTNSAPARRARKSC